MKWSSLAYALVKKLYPHLRPILQEKVNDSEDKLDDIGLSLLDEIFKYN